jgi:hypothetical protein
MPTSQANILAMLQQKAVMKQHVFDVTQATFSDLKTVLAEIAVTYNQLLSESDPRVRLEYHDHGEFVAMLKVAGDMLVFYMHSNTFEFDRDHKIWQQPSVQNDPMNSYTGQINIFNFLSDSFRYNREEDLGYLVGRLFVNRHKHFFVEGKRQRGMSISKFGQTVVDKTALRKIVETAISYALQFDLLVQPYDDVKIVSLAQVNSEIMNSRMRTGKRLGFQYNSDDVR